MESIRYQLTIPVEPLTLAVGEWYLKGFSDAYQAHWAVVPWGPMAEHYTKGYALGLAAVRAEYYAALQSIPVSFPVASETVG